MIPSLQLVIRNKMIKIAQIMGARCLGGAELYFERLNCALSTSGCSTLPIVKRNAPCIKPLKSIGLTPIELNFGGRFDFLTKSKLTKILKKNQPTVVVSWMNRATHHTPAGEWILVGRLGGYYNLKYYKHCDHLIGNTQSIVDWVISQGWPRERVHYLPNFVLDLKSEATHQNDYHLFSAGRLHKNKGFDTLIRALKFLPDVHLTIAGEGPERTALETLISDEKLTERVKLSGWSHDIKAQLAHCSVFVCPSRHEPLGNVIIEAFSAEKPVVATKTDGATSLIIHERNGLLSPIDDPKILAAQIERALSNNTLRKTMTINARNDFEQKFSEKKIVAQWHAFIEKLEK